MLSSLVCGNFQDEEDDELSELLRSCSLSDKKSSKNLRRRHSFGMKSKESKNPYADRGLDKFTALLAELDSKRQKIYTQKGSEDISLLGFAYTSSSDCKPIVVRVRDKKPIKATFKPAEQSDSQVQNKVESSHHDSKQTRLESNHVDHNKASAENLKYNSLWSNIKIEYMRRPAYYVPVIIILILFFLAIFGKSFAILCVSIGWYVIPTINSESAKTSKGRIKTKDHTNNKTKINASNFNTHDHRRTPSSPTSVLTGSKSPPLHGSPLHPRSFT